VKVVTNIYDVLIASIFKAEFIVVKTYHSRTTSTPVTVCMVFSTTESTRKVLLLVPVLSFDLVQGEAN
jgi:hypothetical protein